MSKLYALLQKQAKEKKAFTPLTPEAISAPPAAMAAPAGMPPQAGGMAAPAPAPMVGAPQDAAGMMFPGMGAPQMQPPVEPIPPEIMQMLMPYADMLTQSGFQIDPQNGIIIDMQSGMPLPPEAIQMLLEQIGAVPPSGGQAPAPVQGAPSAPVEQPPAMDNTEVMDAIAKMDSRFDAIESALKDMKDVLQDLVRTVNEFEPNVDPTQTADELANELAGMLPGAAQEPTPAVKTAAVKSPNQTKQLTAMDLLKG